MPDTTFCRTAQCGRGIAACRCQRADGYNVTAVSPMCFLVRRDAFVPLAEGNSLAVDLAQWCMARMQDGMRHVYTPHCVVKADAESAFEGFRVKVPAGWYDPCATGSKRA